MRQITDIIIHCSAVRPNQTSSATQIDRWHKARGWKCIGYHFVIRRDGTIEKGRPLEQIGAHCQGHNANSIGICYEGGLDANGQPADTRTPEQKAAMSRLIKELKSRTPSTLIPRPSSLMLHGHCEYANKSCPCFDVSELTK